MPSSASSLLAAQLAAAGQHEVLEHLESLEAEDHLALAAELAGLGEVASRVARAREEARAVPPEVEAVPAACRAGWRSGAPEREAWGAAGRGALARGEVGVILLAGGQGSRLGSHLPKALQDLGLPSGKTLLHLQAERLLAVERECSAPPIPWYIMTSPATHRPVLEALGANGHYGLRADQVEAFPQGCLPSFSTAGSLLLASPTSVASSPDGNGGLYSALARHDLLPAMRSRGLKHLLLYCVDNALVQPADPAFLGYCIDRGAEAGCKVVEARRGESVGLVGLLDGRPGVREYSEAEGAEGNGACRDGNTCIHYFSLAFLETAVAREAELPLHLATKRIAHWDAATAATVTPEAPNGLKLEKFIFDSFRFVSSSDRFVVWEVQREEEFAPLKRAGPAELEGTPGHCRRALLALHARWLLSAGATLVGPEGREHRKEDEDKDENPEHDLAAGDNCSGKDNWMDQVEAEVSPLVSVRGEGLEQLVGGKQLVTPLHLAANKTYF